MVICSKFMKIFVISFTEFQCFVIPFYISNKDNRSVLVATLLHGFLFKYLEISFNFWFFFMFFFKNITRYIIILELHPVLTLWMCFTLFYWCK